MPEGGLLTETYAKAFEALQYVTNPWALFGYLFLVLIVALSVLKGVSPKSRFCTVLFCGVLTLLMAGLNLQSALDEVRDGSLVHLVRDADAGPVGIIDRVAVKLIDIETLKGKDKPDEDPGGHTFNKRLGDSAHVFEMVLRKAGVTTETAQAVLEMDQKKWDKFLKGLEEIKAESIKDIPFVKLAAIVDGQELTSFMDRWFFKGELIEIPVPGDESVILELVNVYNTKHTTSGEREAVNVRVRTD